MNELTDDPKHLLSLVNMGIEILSDKSTPAVQVVQIVHLTIGYATMLRRAGYAFALRKLDTHEEVSKNSYSGSE